MPRLYDKLNCGIGGETAELTSPLRPCCYEKRFHFCFVQANTIGSMNKTQANRTQTAAAAGYMAECLSPYVRDSEGERGDKTPLIMAFDALTARTAAYGFMY